MEHELEYFTEFLNDSSQMEIGEFYFMLRKWGEYVRDHKEQFNYLEDDEWKEIRERLIAEVRKRDAHKRRLDAELDRIGKALDSLKGADDHTTLAAMKAQADFIKRYRLLYQVSDEDIAAMDQDIAIYTEHIRRCELAEINTRLAKAKLDESIVKLDESLAKYQQQTGKTPILPVIINNKIKKGN